MLPVVHLSHINTVVLTHSHSSDGVTFNVAIAKSLWPLVMSINDIVSLLQAVIITPKGE